MIKKYISVLLLSISFFALSGLFSDIPKASAATLDDTITGDVSYQFAYDWAYSNPVSGVTITDNIIIFPVYNYSSNGAGAFYIYFLDSSISNVNLSVDGSSYKSSAIVCGGYTLYKSTTTRWDYQGIVTTGTNNIYFRDLSTVYSNNVSFYFNGDAVIVPPACSVPFEVTVTPDLYEGMTGNTISYPSKSGGTVTDTLYDINFTVTLSDEFQELFGNSLIQDNGYSFTCFVVPSNYVSEDIDDMASHSIFNYVYYGKFTGDAYDAEFQGFGENTSLINPTDISGSAPDTSLYWHVGEGHTNILAVTCNSPVTEFSFDGNNIDYESNPADSYCVVIHACKSATDLRFAGVPSTFYYNTAYEHHFSDKGTIVTTEGEEVEYYLQYTWVSDKFSYASTPTYAPTSYETQLMSQGLTAENDPFVFTRSPSVVWDDDLMYGKDKDGNTNGVNVKGYSLDEWKEVLSSRQWSNNFNSDFGIGDVTDVLNGESGFFGFLTASFSILPSWFLTIMGSFFVTLIAIVIIKFLL